MASESIYGKKERTAPEAVNLRVEAETGGAQKFAAVPFVVCTIAPLSGTRQPPPLHEQQFVEVDRTNLDKVMNSFKPQVEIRVDNRIEKDGSELPVTLNFQSRADFTPQRIVEQVEQLRELNRQREELVQLLRAIQQKPELEEQLRKVVATTEKFLESKA